MKKNIFIILLMAFLVLAYSYSTAQSILQSGPVVGYSAMREVCLWVQTTSAAKVKFSFWNVSSPQKKSFSEEIKTSKGSGYTAKIIIDDLEPGVVYNYELFINGKKIKRDYNLKFQTQKLWQWREDAPNFSFATGSGAYINETIYDRPGNPYGGQYEIYKSIYGKHPDFMLWLGDNVYLREVDWDSWSGIIKRNTHTRSTLEMQPLFGSMHHYAIWDDHDFGPNNSDRGFWNKEKTLESFKHFWPNPSFGINGKPGTTTYFQWSDVEFFLMDDRYYRTPNDRKTGEKVMWGDEQVEWLIDNLVYSRAPFKFVITGGQFLNPIQADENHSNFLDEKNKILELIEKEGIEGVVFLTGDVHRSEITKMERANSYPLYDFTISPFTSGASRAYPNPWRIESTLTTERNFAIFEFSGPRKDRTLKCTVYNVDGKELWSFSVNENELKNKK
ncbi:MAG: alkaline phosphatase family protein [Ignavibacteria bacterium]|nr:alkaline phosphatase family protein [Ignavibacteria bacterium]